METSNLGGVAYFLVFFFLVCESFGPCASLNDEGRVLLRFRESIEEDPYDSLSNWGGGGGKAWSHCSWFGVDCSTDGRVVALILKDLSLKGMLSPELAKLIHIRILDFSNNSFHGIIPSDFGKLKRLEVLELRQNSLGGAIPSDLEKILPQKLLLLKDNRFSGKMPPKLRELNTVSEALANEGLQKCRKCLTRAIGTANLRQLLQARELQGPASSNQTEREQPPLDSLSNNISQQKNPTETLQPSQPSPPQSRLLPEPKPEPKSSWIPRWAIYSLAIGGAFCLLVVATAMYLVFSRRKKDNTITPWATGLSGQLRKAFVTGVPSLGRAELETACEDFSNVIGTLSDCILYKGTLSSGVEIAVMSTLVKYSKEWSVQSEEQFRNKISCCPK